jgi:outer membrane murein-binding lipoprotein Lpp
VKLKLATTISSAFLLATACFLCTPMSKAQTAQTTSAQQPSAGQQQQLDQDVTLLRQDIRAKKKALMAANLQLTPDQATKFWPIYDQYTAELVKINDQKYAVIKEYAQSWGTMNDDQALSLIKRAIEVDTQVTQLRQKYIPIFNQVVPGKTTATFFQLDRRIQAMIDLQLAAQLPLVQDQGN